MDVSKHSHSYEFEVSSPGTNDTELSVVWSRASDILWSQDNCRGSVLSYLLDYGRRDFPFLKRRLKKLDRKLKRHAACGELFTGDQVESRKLGRIQTLFTEITSHVHVATATFRKPGLRKFLAGGIGKKLRHLREKKHSCVIELPGNGAQFNERADESDFEALLDELLREVEKDPSVINPNISSDGLARFHSCLDDLGTNTGTLPETPVTKLTNQAGNADHVVDASSIKCIRLKRTEIQVCVGDLTKETTDAILVINQPNLNLRDGGRLNQHVAQAGGPALRMECDLNVIERGAQPSGSAVVTDAGELLCKHVVHAVCASSSLNVLDLQLAVKSGLQLADGRGLTSIALPAIGTGGMGLSWKTSAQILSRGILSFLESVPLNLSQIRIVLFEHKMFAFVSEEVINEFVPAATLEEYSPLSIPSEDNKHPSDLQQSIWTTNALDGGSASFAPESVPKFRVRVYGRDQKSILNALTGLQMDFATYESSQKIIHHLVPQLLQGGWSQLHNIAHWYEVTIRPESNARTIAVCGNPDDVSLVVGRIWEQINACAEENTEREKHRLLSKYVCWYFVILDLHIACSERVNGILEGAHDQRFKEISFCVSNREFKADFGSMTILCSFSNYQPLPLVRKNLVETVDPPSSWVPHPSDNQGDECPVLLVCLDSSSCEYNHVAGVFYSTGGKGDIIKIERIQNPYLHKQYTVCKKEIERPNSRHSIYRLNELQLFHGTQERNLKSINRQGFNRSFSGTHAGAMYGKGVYFAKNASYAMAYTSNSFGERHMYLARVMIGLFTKGRRGLLVPPPVDCEMPEVHYDTLVDNVDNPTVFVVFRDAQCYPEYLLTLKSS